MSKSAFFITGCAGFIASKTAEILLKEGHNVVGIDNMNDYYDPRLKQHRIELLNQFENFTFHEGNIDNLELLQFIFQANEFSAVINLAARAGVRYSIENPFVYMATNGNGTLNLLELTQKHRIKKFVLASTSSLYAGQEMPFTEDLPVNRPISPYAATKKAAEVMAYTYHHLYNIDVSVVRYFTVFGPSGRPDMATFRFIKWIDEGTAIEMFGDGSQSRDWTYVDDIARGTIAAATTDVGYEIINLGGGRSPKTLKAMVAVMEQELGKEAVINYKPFHNADMKDTCADISKAKKLLDWEPLISPEEGIKRTVAWYLENKSWLNDIKI